MDRQIVYVGSLPQDTDFLNMEQEVMIAFGSLLNGILGAGPVVSGLACTPTSPASMTVNVAPGFIAATEVVDANAYGSLGTNSNALVKAGINLTSTPFTLTAPGTTGDSQVFLIEASFLESDTGSEVLAYFNAANPAQPFAGPANSGTSQNTQRIQRCALQVVAGSPAATGTQTAPATTSGWTALWLVTLAYGQTTITSGNIVAASGVPTFPTLPSIPGSIAAAILAQANVDGMQVFTAGTSTFTVPAGWTRYGYMLQGAGGGGGGGNGGAAPGGGSGAFAWGVVSDTPFNTHTVVVGSGGAGGSNTGNGANGGTTSFNGISCTGGAGGSAGSSVNQIPGGLGGSATGGTLNVPGSGGGIATIVSTSNLQSGSGAPSFFGGGGTPATGTSTYGFSGGTATVQGSAGAGATGTTGAFTGTPTVGGNGADGVAIFFKV